MCCFVRKFHVVINLLAQCTYILIRKRTVKRKTCIFCERRQVPEEDRLRVRQLRQASAIEPAGQVLRAFRLHPAAVLQQRLPGVVQEAAEGVLVLPGGHELEQDGHREQEREGPAARLLLDRVLRQVQRAQRTSSAQRRSVRRVPPDEEDRGGVRARQDDQQVLQRALLRGLQVRQQHRHRPLQHVQQALQQAGSEGLCDGVRWHAVLLLLEDVPEHLHHRAPQHHTLLLVQGQEVQLRHDPEEELHRGELDAVLAELLESSGRLRQRRQFQRVSTFSPTTFNTQIVAIVLKKYNYCYWMKSRRFCRSEFSSIAVIILGLFQQS